MRILLTLAAILVFPAAAFAHTGVGPTGGFVHGFGHPVGGLDHILAMFAVGLFAYTLGGRALWLVPGAFVAMMAAGGVAGVMGLPLPAVELGIALSVAVLGLVVATGLRLPVAAAMGLVGAFAIFHGHAHGAEMPADTAGLAYGAGFMLATASLHAAGIAAAAGAAHLMGTRGRVLARLGGGAIALAGVGLVAGVF